MEQALSDRSHSIAVVAKKGRHTRRSEGPKQPNRPHAQSTKTATRGPDSLAIRSTSIRLGGTDEWH